MYQIVLIKLIINNTKFITIKNYYYSITVFQNYCYYLFNLQNIIIIVTTITHTYLLNISPCTQTNLLHYYLQIIRQ